MQVLCYSCRCCCCCRSGAAVRYTGGANKIKHWRQDHLPRINSRQSEGRRPSPSRRCAIASQPQKRTHHPQISPFHRASYVVFYPSGLPGGGGWYSLVLSRKHAKEFFAVRKPSVPYVLNDAHSLGQTSVSVEASGDKWRPYCTGVAAVVGVVAMRICSGPASENSTRAQGGGGDSRCPPFFWIFFFFKSPH